MGVFAEDNRVGRQDAITEHCHLRMTLRLVALGSRDAGLERALYIVWVMRIGIMKVTAFIGRKGYRFARMRRSHEEGIVLSIRIDLRNPNASVSAGSASSPAATKDSGR